MTNGKRTTFYIGLSNSIIRRVIEHQNGLGSEFTKKYKLEQLVYYECYQYIKDAIAREKELKGWSREKKIALIRRKNSEMKDLGRDLLENYGITQEEKQEITEQLKLKYNK